MTLLLIMRHGEAEHGFPDAQRRLTARGEEEVERMALWLSSRLDVSTRRSLCIAASPFVRAQQTARHMGEALGKRIETLPLITPDEPVKPVIDWLQEHGDGTPWLLVSHMPLVGSLVGRLADGEHRGSRAMATATVAILEADVWAAGCARLVDWQTPADIS
ncbi:phosphohistidine phosphatase SixA [Halomonas sp. WWR20]